MKIFKPMTKEHMEIIDRNDERGFFDWEFWWSERLTWYGRLRFALGLGRF